MAFIFAYAGIGNGVPGVRSSKRIQVLKIRGAVLESDTSTSCTGGLFARGAAWSQISRKQAHRHLPCSSAGHAE